jgi:hypothetical protein
METLKKNKGNYIKAALAVLAAILIVLFALLFRQYSDLRRERLLNEQAVWLSFASRRAPLPPTEAAIVQPWMTFDYVDRLFALPRAYLQTALQVADPHYPQIPLYRYAESQHLDPWAFTDEVRGAVKAYQPAVK